MRRHDAERTLGMGALALLGAAITGRAYWPGLMSWDPVRQYGEALSGDIDDWHPPAMQWLWQRLIAIHPGPAPMLIVQLALYWGGLALLAATVAAAGRRRTGWALLACGLLPLGLALTGAILKDNLMAGALLVATGLLAVRIQSGAMLPAIAATVLLLCAATLRFNAFTACLPLMIALLPPSWWRRPARLVPATLLASVALVAAMPVANHPIAARRSGVELSLVIFDLGGITEHSGTSVFPAELDVRDPVAVNHRCYRPAKWDSYSDWVDPECPLGFTAWNDDVASAGIDPYPLWIRAVLGHPLAYAAHRLSHIAINTRIVPLADAVERPMPIADAPNPWGYRLTPNPMLTTVDALAVATAHTPLGWPIVWIALAWAALVLGWRREDAALIVPLAASSLLYGLGYAVMSVAAELRYHLWTELAALLAIVLVAGEWRPVARSRLALACAPALVAILAAAAMRL